MLRQGDSMPFICPNCSIPLKYGGEHVICPMHGNIELLVTIPEQFTVVIYKGGEAPEVFWECNYFLFDNNNEFLNLYSSGNNGVKDINEALHLMKDKTYERDVRVYKLLNEAAYTSFQNSEPVELVREVLMALVKCKPTNEFGVTCMGCNELIKVSKSKLGGIMHIGNNVYQRTELLCEKCWEEKYGDNGVS